ncbi:MAG: PfkB family carbohydrate kinase [Candidatus Izemoplasmatales bacterium]|jgi:fructokinase|nr:PfkB family carbohydrate kinase [Candidatus Izemoplasmatales bacterium]
MPFNQKIPLPMNQKYDVILIGEILVDIIIDKETELTEQLFGGSPANIALNLKQLGLSSRLFGAVGNDEFGTFLLNNLNENQMDYHVDVVNSATSFVTINKSSSTPIPMFSRHSDTLIPFSKELKSDLLKTKIVHFSFWPLSKSSSRLTIEKAIEEAKKNHAIIGFDPNYHPLLDNSKKTGLAALRNIIGKVDIIKPSLDDSIRIFGDNHSLEEYLQFYQDLGCKLVIMTLGEKGLIAKYENESLVLPSYATDVVDTTGAGDAFWSGLYGGMCKGYNILTSIKLGLLCSAYNLQVVGANANLPNIDYLLNSLESR